jgi:hypothetical protein
MLKDKLYDIEDFHWYTAYNSFIDPYIYKIIDDVGCSLSPVNEIYGLFVKSLYVWRI